MNRTPWIFLAAFVAVAFSGCRPETDQVTVSALRCEYRVNPEGIGIAKPRFGWREISKERNQSQAAYRIEVSDSRSKIFWDSGKVRSDQSQGIVYAGAPLQPGEVYVWKVRLWDAHGRMTAWSGPSTFSTAIGEWHAQWIGRDVPPETNSRNTAGLAWVKGKSGKAGSLILSKQIALLAGQVPTKAMLMLFPDNFCTAQVNGQPAGEAVRWDQTTRLDLTKFFHPGTNTVSLTVTNSDGLPAAVVGRVLLTPESGPVLDLPIDTTWGDVTDLGMKKSRDPKTPWGTPALNDQPRIPVAYLRKEFTTGTKEVRRAVLSVTALGAYEIRLNGSKVGEDVLAPGWTEFRKRVPFQTHDVTRMIRVGTNALAAELADGWYAGPLAFTGKRNFYGGNPRIKAELTIDYADGTTERVVTDGSWKAGEGPIRSAGLLLGSEYDATKSITGWDLPGFNDSMWTAVSSGLAGVGTNAPKEPLLVADVSCPPRIQELLPTVKVTEPAPGVAVFDLGQNMSGWARLKLKGRPGQRLVVRYGEFLNPDGTLYTANLRGATSTDRFTLAGSGEEILEPSFTFHGFRYVEVRGLDGKPDPWMVTGVVVHTPMERSGFFECSSPLLNQLFHNIVWGQKSNYIDVPTDCPQRDERAGWTGDAEFFVPTAAYNFNVDPFFAKWLTTLCEDSQGPDGFIPSVAPDLFGKSGGTAWADAAVICPYQIWKTYGDLSVIRDHFPAMERYMDWISSKSTNGIPVTGHYGDWLNKGGGATKEVIDTAYYAHDARLMAEMARAIGNKDAGAKYEKLHADVKKTFAGFFDPDGTLKGCSQTGYTLAFSMGLVPDEFKEKAAEKFGGEITRFNDHLATGFIGTPRLLPALHAAGRDDLANRLLLQESYPSWLFQVKLGATTMWERWDGWTPDNGFQDVGMNSFNHYAFGSVGEYLYGMIGGIQPITPGFKTMLIAPVVGHGITWAKVSFDSVYGKIASNWSLKDSKLSMEVTIPPNTTATIRMPTSLPDQVQESGTPISEVPNIKTLHSQKGALYLKVGSGKYEFVAPFVQS